jgi:hypothetical protein
MNKLITKNKDYVEEKAVELAESILDMYHYK